MQLFVEVDYTDSHVIPKFGVVLKAVRTFLESTEGLIPLLVLIESKSEVE